MISEKRLRSGLKGAQTARIWIIASVCAFQYWLLTASMESMHAGNNKVPIPAFITTLLCLFFNGWLVFSGEKKPPEKFNEKEHL
jgi:hypothetical protein